jgi:AcrR family transcriptional regulator
MSRTVGSSGPKTIAAIRQAGLRLIYQHGYEAMSLRNLAAEVGIQQGSLYNHIRTKQELLFDLITVHMNDLLRELDDALSPERSAVEQLKAFVQFHVGYHVTRKQEVFICYSELRSLEPENFQAVSEMRRTYERKLMTILEEGVAEGSFVPTDMKIAAYGILSMLSGICTWFNPEGRLSKDDISQIFTTMVLNSVMHADAEGSHASKPPVPLEGKSTPLAQMSGRL